MAYAPYQQSWSSRVVRSLTLSSVLCQSQLWLAPLRSICRPVVIYLRNLHWHRMSARRTLIWWRGWFCDYSSCWIYPHVIYDRDKAEKSGFWCNNQMLCVRQWCHTISAMLTVFLLYKYTKSHSENASENSLRVLLEVCLVFQEGFASQCRSCYPYGLTLSMCIMLLL